MMHKITQDEYLRYYIYPNDFYALDDLIDKPIRDDLDIRFRSSNDELVAYQDKSGFYAKYLYWGELGMISDVFTCDDIGLLEQILEDIRADSPNAFAFEGLLKKINDAYFKEQGELDLKTFRALPDCTQREAQDKQ